MRNGATFKLQTIERHAHEYSLATENARSCISRDLQDRYRSVPGEPDPNRYFCGYNHFRTHRLFSSPGSPVLYRNDQFIQSHKEQLQNGRRVCLAVSRDESTVGAALGIEHPIVLAASFGGKVAMAYMTRHPTHPPTDPHQHRKQWVARKKSDVSPCSIYRADQRSARWRAVRCLRDTATRQPSRPGSASPFRSIPHTMRSKRRSSGHRKFRSAFVVHEAWRGRPHV